ncbi:DUF1614 domain-containing protein [Caldisericum exile]|uniref:Hypothetical membrane protein n=1 Tax=Caldisericum exile (strain DSM 21853 / NBRC 104410 / AZM16c01) TaxID=511051 RepID=A0A7U6GF54_CALEA|nr:DUF1614 domain-containing protein [Caldisericum exile]BAL81192.1 hypothetical membrane protein [Caldisericum exile AZM16c01]
MNNKNYIYFPFEFTMLIVLFVLFLLIYPVFFFLFAGGIVEAFSRLGFSPITGTLVFLLSLFGSAINIPITKITTQNPIVQERVVYFYGIPYKIPFVTEQTTVVAINFGGAIIPIFISIYEFLRILSAGRLDIALLTIIGIVIISIVVHSFAKPVKGVGIAVPFFIPPIITAIVALILSRQYAPIIAYVSGTLGTLIGADILNLNNVSELGAPVVSIGGAGTFDGIFLTGILSTLLV